MGDQKLSKRGLELFFISLSVLSLELCLIRWTPGQVRVIAYFPNLVLIASFLGLGVGALTKQGGAPRFLVALAVNLGVAIALGGVIFYANNVSEHLWLLYYDLPRDTPTVEGIVWPLALVFATTTFVFIPLGYAIAQRLNDFKARKVPLLGYALDLGGSLAGVLVFLAFSGTSAPPVLWFAVGLLAAFPIAGPTKTMRVVYAAGVAGALILVANFDRAERYSPYYGITVHSPSPDFVHILTNGSLHQSAFDMRRANEPNFSETIVAVANGYRTPIESLRELPQRALVLGAGSGNDVSILLDAGVPEVHAVEIDPVIIEIGRERHPADPYHDPRVIVHNTDARTFLESTPLDFDLIVFGTLDSMTKLSALSNVRLDNFVYTVDSIRAAKSRLAPGGGMALLFMCSDDALKLRIFAMIERAWGTPPLVKSGAYSLFNTLFLTGPGYEHLRADPAWNDASMVERSPRASAPTDDWPYLYLASRTIPQFYFQVGACILAIAFALLLVTSTELRRDIRAGRIDFEMILFGAAFLLLESSYITQLNLLFGATWIASGVVFAAVLVGLLLATLLGHYRPVDLRLALAVMIAGLVVASAVPLVSFAPASSWGRLAFALVYCGLPILGAGLAFAACFRLRTNLESAFGWNIIGAVMGGLIEFGSMLTGLRAMFLIAAAIYGLLLLRAVRAASKPAV